MPGQAEPRTWTGFSCDGHAFEYVVTATKVKSRPAGWPAHKASPGSWTRAVGVCVRRPGDETGPAMIYAEGTAITVEHARETARWFWSELTR